MTRLLVVLLALAPLAAGCGSDPSSFEGSGDALKDASTSRVEWKIEGSKLPDWAVMRLAGSVDYANGRGEIVIKGKSDSAPEARGVFLDHTTYLGAKVDGAMYWVKQQLDTSTGSDRFLPGPGGPSPDRLLKALIAASTKVENLGSEDIRGVDTTHYRAHLEKTKYSKKPGVVEVWVDGQGLPRRIRIPYGGEPAAASVMDLYDFGVPVDVEAPPATEIIPEEKFETLMDKECAATEKAPEAMSPLCLFYGGESGDSIQVSPDRTFTTTEGK